MAYNMFPSYGNVNQIKSFIKNPANVGHLLNPEPVTPMTCPWFGVANPAQTPNPESVTT